MTESEQLIQTFGGISPPWTGPIVGSAFAPNVGGPLAGYASLASLTPQVRSEVRPRID
jgi:hypothetical protein